MTPGTEQAEAALRSKPNGDLRGKDGIMILHVIVFTSRRKSAVCRALGARVVPDGAALR